MANIPVLSQSGPLPINIRFFPGDPMDNSDSLPAYRDLLLQRMRIYLSGENGGEHGIILGSMNEEPQRDSGPWFNDPWYRGETPVNGINGSWWIWKNSSAAYIPAPISVSDGSDYAVTLAASPTANRIQSFSSQGDDPINNPVYIALLTDIYVPRETVVIGSFEDGASFSDNDFYSDSALFDPSDVDLSITGDNIQPLTTITAYVSPTLVTLSKPTLDTGDGLSFNVEGRTIAVIDGTRSSDFIMTLVNNIETKVTAVAGQNITIALINDGTNYSVTWPTDADNAVMFPGGDNAVQPVSSTGESVIGIYTILENQITEVDQHLWCKSNVNGLNNTPPTPLTYGNPDPYYGGGSPPSGGNPLDP